MVVGIEDDRDGLTSHATGVPFSETGQHARGPEISAARMIHLAFMKVMRNPRVPP